MKDQRWPGTWMALGIFFALFTYFWVGPRTLVDAEMLVKLLVVCGLAMLLLPYRATGLRLGMERFEWFLFNVLALGPTLSGLVLWSNLVFHGPVTWGEAPIGRAIEVGLPTSDGRPQHHMVRWPGDQRFSKDDVRAPEVRSWRVGVAHGWTGHAVVVTMELVQEAG